MTTAITLEGLLKHAERFGTNSPTDRRGNEKGYGSYKALSADPIVEVGLHHLSKENYVLLIEGLGYPTFRKEAEAHWEAAREEWLEDQALYGRFWGRGA